MAYLGTATAMPACRIGFTRKIQPQLSQAHASMYDSLLRRWSLTRNETSRSPLGPPAALGSPSPLTTLVYAGSITCEHQQRNE
eukprot:1557973-Rhodomonas_salina.1